jgi:hypothetical protein
MPRSIVSQNDQYGLGQREAAALPPESEIAELLSRPGITAGLLNRYDQDES